MCNALLGRRPVARFDQTARIMVQPVGRALHTPHHDLLRNPHDFERLIGQNDQRVIQTRRIDANLVVADAFEHQDDFLSGRMGEVYCFVIGNLSKSQEVTPCRVAQYYALES
jgi:hypothetical protein